MHRQEKENLLEAGGMLLGRIIEGTDDIIIDEATLPHLADSRGRGFFVRACKPAQEIVNMAWKKSKGAVNYLGEWHTHPEAHPSPSSKDILNWKNVVIKTVYEQEELVFIIVGTEMISVWNMKRSSVRASKCPCIRA